MSYAVYPGTTSYPAVYTANTSSNCLYFDVAWDQPPEEDGGGALVGAMVPVLPLAPCTGATADPWT
jgi:hypothetical protein